MSHCNPVVNTRLWSDSRACNEEGAIARIWYNESLRVNLRRLYRALNDDNDHRVGGVTVPCPHDHDDD